MVSAHVIPKRLVHLIKECSWFDCSSDFFFFLASVRQLALHAVTLSFIRQSLNWKKVMQILSLLDHVF